MNAKMYPVAALVLLAGWMVTSVARPAIAETKSDKTKPAEETQAERPYLGVAIEPLHPGTASHLPDVLIEGQGVLVSYVTPDSPAAKAGVQRHDILVQYGDQKLFSAEQLAKLVRADKKGHAVDVKLVRGGKLQSVQVTLDARDASNMASHASHPWRREFSLPWFGHHRAAQPKTDRDQSQDWRSFDSMTLKRLGDGKFQAEIKYLDDQSKMQHHTFKGTRDEIVKSINAEENLPQGERDHLLNAIEHPRHAMVRPDFDFDPDFSAYWPFPSDF